MPVNSADAVRYHAQFRRALEDGDYMLLWKLWAHIMPHLPALKTPQEAQAVMHRARTESVTLHVDKRAYSHRWCLDNGIPSGLPDALKPRAERMYPEPVKAVGVAVSLPKIFREVAREIEGAMSGAVEELAADGVDLNNRAAVHALMFERREQVLDVMLGRGARPQGINRGVT